MSDRKREKLIEEYEDALFALLMDEVAQAEGERAIQLNKQLKEDPNAAVPLSLQNRSKQTIRTAFAKENFHRTVCASKKVFRMVSAAVFICVMLFTTAFAVSSDFRRSTLNAVIEVFDEYSVLKFENIESVAGSKQHGADEEIVYSYNIGLKWVPDGFEISQGWDHTSNDFVEYVNDEGAGFNVFIVSVFEDALYQFDTENTEMIPVTVQGYPAELYRKDDGRLTVLWIDTEKQGVMQVLAVGLSQEDVLKIAEGVIWGG